MSQKYCVYQTKERPARQTRVGFFWVPFSACAWKYSLAFVAVAALGVAGCSPADEPTAPAPEKSTSRQALEGFTGKTAVDAGLRTKEKIQSVNKTREENSVEF